jgi:hypothetical protein
MKNLPLRLLLWSCILAAWGHTARALETQPSGRFINPTLVAAIPTQPHTHPMFGHWLIGEGRPVVCRFVAQPNTHYRVFVGLNEAFWDRAGQRVMDIEIAGKVVATLESFHKAKGTPSGFLCRTTADARGRVEVRVCPHPGAPDQNPIVCGVLLFPDDAALDVKSVIHNHAPQPLVSLLAGTQTDTFATARFVNDRSDCDLVATLGTCYLDEFRFFTMLHQESWDWLRWETLGNAVLDHRTWSNWPYEQRLSVQAGGVDVSPDSAHVDRVEQQFDFRQVSVSSPSLKLDRLDMMLSARQWTTALRVTNPQTTPSRVVVEVEWLTRNNAPLDVRPWSDRDCKGFAYSIENGPPILVAIGANGTWKKKGNTAVCNRWQVDLKAGEAATLDVNVHIGWKALHAYRDSGPGEPSTDQQATMDRRADRKGFQRVAAALGVSSLGNRWSDLQKVCEARRRYLYDRMPRLQGFAPKWAGMWAYTFDVLRSGLYPPQGTFKDVWMVGDLVVYREPFCWDGPLSVHSFCNWDAAIAARTLRTFLTSTKADGELCVSANPYRTYPNPTPQLANNTMALWDCYQITRDKAALAACYPLIVKHVRWLETKRNRTPNGPLMDIGWNIDYGQPSLYASPTIWVDVQMFLVDRYRRLAKIAAVLGKPKEEIAEWTQRANRLAAAIRKHMWDDKIGTFWCVSDKLAFKRVGSPIEFCGMTAGVATPDQARRLLLRLKDPAKYAPSKEYPFGLPSTPFDDPNFQVQDGWSGSIWPVQTYYTVRGLVDYGYQDEAAALTSNLYGMMARFYRETGTIYEQYDPRNGKAGCDAGLGRGYFVSGITTSVADMLLRGVVGFERTDDPAAFYLTPRPLTNNWHGIENLPLSGDTRLSIQVKDEGRATACRVKFSGLDTAIKLVAVHLLNLQDGTRKLVKEARLNDQNEVTISLEKSNHSRHLWELRK